MPAWRLEFDAWRAARFGLAKRQSFAVSGLPYEYEHGKLAIDVINGGPLLREWVDDAAATPQDLDALAIPDEQAWLSERQAHLRY